MYFEDRANRSHSCIEFGYKKGKSRVFSEILAEQPEEQNSIKRDRKDYKNRFVDGGDCGWGWEEGGAQSWSC